MPLKEALTNDLKDAMRQRDAVRRDTIRLLLSAIGYEEKAKRTNALDDDAVMQVLSRQAQQRRDSIEAYQKGDRPDLVAKEEAELAIVVQYLPQPLSEDEIAAIVQSAIADVSATGPQDMGKVMGKVMPQVRARADGKQVSALVNQTLRSL
ncbi:MAG: GatB/YqeY domain-containing protein [Chloroflexota bacterium]|nr:GatB/YqeY domain-containing protein [Chloroflexota bacterium]